jgi:hypothetical protein
MLNAIFPGEEASKMRPILIIKGLLLSGHRVGSSLRKRKRIWAD